MKLTRLSEHGYLVESVFDRNTFNNLYNICKLSDMQQENDTLRDKIGITGALFNILQRYFEPHLRSITPEFLQIGGMELWRDYGGYTNAYHLDDPAVGNVMIVYLETNPDTGLGTGYVDTDGNGYQVPYTTNTGIIVLNSNAISHGLVGKVPADTTRYTFYLNWK